MYAQVTRTATEANPGSMKLPREATIGPYSDSPAWNKGMKMPAGVPLLQELKDRLLEYQRHNTGSGTLKDPKVMWACPYGKVPDARGVDFVNPDDILRLNTEPGKMDTRGKAIATMAYELAKDLGFPFVLILGSSHAWKNEYDTQVHRSTGRLVPDHNHFTATFTDDPGWKRVGGHIYIEVDEWWIPTGLNNSRVITGIPRRAVDLHFTETTTQKTKRDLTNKAKLNNTLQRKY
ncbi:hypothetical protein PG997_008565 [Apiospora hydei]|uniref:Uncharacterized protein n=1 Tax=Apiospora hydei TaxID=1337664 RepID=A0ABR1WB84_9PEZI